MNWNPFKSKIQKDPDLSEVFKSIQIINCDSIFDERCEGMFSNDGNILRHTGSNSIIAYLLDKKIYLVTFKSDIYIKDFFTFKLNVVDSFQLCKKLYLSDMQMDDVLDRINRDGIDNLSKLDLIFLLKSKK